MVPASVKCPDHHVEQVYNSVGPEIAVNLPPVETEGGGINVNVQYHPPNGSQWHLDRPLIVNVSVIDENGSQAWCQFSYMAETADCPSWQINSRYKCTQKSNITICSASVCPTREIPPNIQELVCVPGHGWRILEENIDSTSITHLGSAPKMQSAPICVSEMMSSVTLVLNYQLSNADWQCSRDFLERIRSKMSQFLEEQCTDVGWTYSGADMANASKLGLNFTTHNRDTPAVLGCIDSITGHVPLIPPPCPNSGVRRNTTKYHLRCPTGWGANNRLRCEKCPPGYHVDNESCAPCPRGTYNVNPEFTDCIACPEGQTTLSDAAMGEHMCVAQCPPGFFSRRSGLAPCSPCPQGTYQPDSGQEGCLSCGDGLTTTELGTKDVNDCRSQCLTGFYSPYGVEPCEPCPIGHYNEGEGPMMCHRCPPGFTTARVGSTGPNECRVSSCSSAGCSNRGECLGDICKCEIGFTGNTCDVPFNLCNASFCLNNGVCNFNENNGSFCTCSEGFSGRRCEIDMAKMTQRFKRKAGRWSSSSSQSWHQSSWFNSSSTGDTESPEIRFAPTTKAKTTLIPRTTTRHRPPKTIPTTTQTPDVTTESVATTLGTTSQQIMTISASSQSSVDGYCQLNDCYDGKCSSEANICNCNDGFKRDDRDLKRCIQDKSCRNLGICVKNNTKEVHGDWDTGKCCICLDGYSGNYCEIEPKDDGCCTKNSDCLGGKTCLFDTNSNCGHCYEKCDDNHYLKDCNKPAYNKFNETKCKNGGKLAYLEDKHMVYCDCQRDGNEMYIGEYCDYRLSRCHKEHTSRLICENAGKCRDDGTRSYCECPEGFTGERCETMIDHCDLAKNGGCVAENTAEYIPHHLSCYCYCKEGYFNETCADEIDPCKERGEDWCGNGVCQSDGPGYAGKHECVCNGKNLLSEDRCLSWKSPCDDNTTCDKRCKVKAHNETVCACRDGYYGETCDPIDYCLSGVCLNDGICHQGVNISKNPWMKCECKEGALGENCEKLTACNGISCGANGTCIEEEGGRYHCECNVGWWGSMCEKPALKCSEGNSPHNCDHGTCNLENDVCECDPGYTGVNCTIPNKNGFNLYFTGEPTDPAKGEVTISGERTGEHAITLTAWVRFEDDVIGNNSVKMTPITVELNEKPVFEISNNGTTWSGSESLSYTGCKLRGWNYYVISYNNTKKILKATINNQYVYQREVAAIQPSGTWSIVLGRKTRDNDFFRGEVGLVELHNKLFTAEEIQRYMENCTGNPFNPENVIVKWKDLKLKGWQRNDVQVIVPGICAQSKCESGAADCSPDSDRFPPLPRNCPSIIKRSTKNRVMQIEWDTKDMFTDDNPIVRISSNYAPNQTFAWGYYHVVYVAVDVKGNIGRCEFDVIVGNDNLPDPYEVDVKAVRKPVDSDEIVEYARLECEGDQNFLKDTSPFYTKDVLHRWSRFETAPLSSYPSCVATTNPEQKVSGGLTWIRGDCKESERIKREIIESLNNASIKFKQEHGLDEGFCPADDCQNITRIDDSCVEEGLRHGRDVEADLGAEKITYEYRLSVNNTKFIVRPFINITLHEWFNDSREYDPTYPLQNFACDPSYPFVRHVQNVTETLDLQFCTDWPAGSFFQSGMNESAPCPVNKCQPNSTQDECVDCPGGRITKDVGCKDEKTECYFPCPAGQYGTYNVCILCPFGYYNPKPNSSSCATCGSGRTTNTTGADSVSFCYEKCAYLPGHVLDEKDECQECPRGTYRKGTQCQQCNPGFTTRTSAANSEDECSVVDCPRGYTLNKKYKDSFNNITDPHRQYTTYCEPCDRFSFKEVTGNEECQPCPKGTSTNMWGSRAVNDCNVTACNPGLSNSCTDGKKCTETDGGQSFTCQYPNLDKSKEENWLYLILLGFFILLFVLLLLLFVSNKRELLRYIDVTCPWLLFCWMRKEGNRRFSVNPTRDTSNLPFSPNTQSSAEMENTSTTEVSVANDPLDSASAIESLPSEEHWMKQRTKHTTTLDPLTEIRTNLMHVMTSATSAVSSDSSGKRTPPPILTGSPSRRDMEAAKAAARVARSETYQMATFGQSSPVQSPRVKVEAGIIRHHRTVGPTMVEARPLRAPQFIPRVNTIQAPAPRLASTTEEDDEGFFC